MTSEVIAIRIDNLQHAVDRAIKWRQSATHPDDIEAADDRLKLLRLELKRLKEAT